MQKNLDELLHDYYNKSSSYIELMRTHNADYFKSYLNLISKYVKGADTLLEIGCGSGASTYHIAHKFQFINCFGLDISEPEIKFAKKNYSLKNLHFNVGSAKSINYLDNSFSIVTSFDTLEHIPNLGAVLHEIMRVIKPGGYIIVKGPNHINPLYTMIDLVLFRHRFPFTRSWTHNFARLVFEISHLLLGLLGKVKFIERIPELSDNIQVGNDADAVNEMCNIDLYNFFKKRNWRMHNMAWPRGSGSGGGLVSKLLPIFGSMGIVAQKI